MWFTLLSQESMEHRMNRGRLFGRISGGKSDSRRLLTIATASTVCGFSLESIRIPPTLPETKSSCQNICAPPRITKMNARVGICDVGISRLFPLISSEIVRYEKTVCGQCDWAGSCHMRKLSQANVGKLPLSMGLMLLSEKT
jgi:hypothetical protein